jgi:hypothetical protein
MTPAISFASAARRSTGSMCAWAAALAASLAAAPRLGAVLANVVEAGFAAVLSEMELISSSGDQTVQHAPRHALAQPIPMAGRNLLTRDSDEQAALVRWI